MDPTQLEQLLEKRKKMIDEAGAAIEARETERQTFEARDTSDTKPTDEERSAFAVAEEAFNADFQRRQDEIKALDQRIDQEQMKERRREEAARASRGVSVTSEPLTYRKDNKEKVSYFRDLAVVSVPGLASRMEDPTGAQDRLQRHAAEMNVELPKREEARERRAQARIDQAEREFTGSFVPELGVSRRGLDSSPFERRVNPSRTDGQGGYFVPPLWLVDEYIPGLRAGRVAAGRCRQIDLPEGTDSINIPKLSTLTQVGVQTADNQPVTSQDITDTAVTATVKTLAGQEDVAIQLIEQSPGRIIDQVIIEDLMADYNRLVDRQVVSGSGSAGQMLGIYPGSNWAGTASVTPGAGSAKAAAFNMVLGALASRVATNRFSVEDLHFLLHPRRWYWFATGLDGDTNGRPVVNRESTGYNLAALDRASGLAEGLVGEAEFGPHGIYIDANVPTADTTGGGTGQDVAIGAKWDDLWLFEGELRTRVLPEILSGTLEIRFQVYNYVAFLARYGESIAIGAGAGLAAPKSAFDTAVTF